MENAEEIFHFLEEFSKRKTKIIPQELNEYLVYVARTGDPVFQWSLVKSLFKEKLLNVITDFYETTPGIDIPPYPNVDPFNYDIMKNSLLERLDTFTSAPFTVQRICELLTFPRKQYNRIDKFMRAIEKNILVVSTREPGIQRHPEPEPENGEPIEAIANGSDNNSEYNVDVEMEDMSWKENSNQQQNSEPLPSSSDAQNISANAIEDHVKAKEDSPIDSSNKASNEYESVTPPELNINIDEQTQDFKPIDESTSPNVSNILKESVTPVNEKATLEDENMSEVVTKETISEPETKTEDPIPVLIIPEIKIDDCEMTEQKLSEQLTQSTEEHEQTELSTEKDPLDIEIKEAPSQISIDDNNSDSNTKEEVETKHSSEVLIYSEESSSSSDNVDGNSNSPKLDSDSNTESHEESNQPVSLTEKALISSPEKSESSPEKCIPSPERSVSSPETLVTSPEKSVNSSEICENTPEKSKSSPKKIDEKTEETEIAAETTTNDEEECHAKLPMESDNYSISDVNSEFPQPVPETDSKPEMSLADSNEKCITETETDKKEDEIKTDITIETPTSETPS